MSLSPGARRAEAFAALLDRPQRTDDPALAPYLALAGALQAVPAAPGPRPEFRAALRQRLVAVAAVQGVAEPEGVATRLREGITWNFQRRMAILAGGAAAATAIAGVGVGASRSLPGDPFYGVKRATERVQLATAVGQEAKGKRHLEFARTRLSEIQALAGQDSALQSFLPGASDAVGLLTDQAKVSTIIATLHDMDTETRAGADDLVAVARDTGSTEPLRALDEFTRAQFADLRSVLPELPIQAQPRAQASLALLSAVGQRTAALFGTSGTPSGKGGGHKSGGSSATSKPSSKQTSSASQPATATSSPAPTAEPSTVTVPTQLPTDVPTIPSLPSSSPLPTELPTELPSLPDLPSLLDQ